MCVFTGAHCKLAAPVAGCVIMTMTQEYRACMSVLVGCNHSFMPDLLRPSFVLELKMFSFFQVVAEFAFAVL